MPRCRFPLALSACCGLALAGCAPRAARALPELNAVAASGTWTVLFHATMLARHDGPYEVMLDSGVVHRLEAIGDPAVVNVTPAALGPIDMPRVGTLLNVGSVAADKNAPFVAAPAPGRYRVWTESAAMGTLQVRIYRDASDQASLACVRDPRTAGCRGEPGRPASTVGGLLGGLSVIAAIAAWFLVW